MMPAYVIVQQYFTTDRALATGISTLGLAFGNVAIPPVTGLLIETYGWRGAILLSAGIALNALVLAALYRPPTDVAVPSNLGHDYTNLDMEGTENTDLVSRLLTRWRHSVFSDTCFLLCVLGTVLMYLGMLNFTQHSPSRAVFHGIESHEVLLLLPIFGASEAVSRLFFSFIANLSCTNRTLEYSLGILLGGVVLLASSFTEDFLTLATCTAMYGICTGKCWEYLFMLTYFPGLTVTVVNR